MTAPTQAPASPPLTVLTQQGSNVRGHDPAQQEKITKFFQGLLGYRPFAEMVIGSGMDVSRGVTGISAQLAVGNRLILNVKGNGTTTPFLIGQDTSQGFVTIPGIDEKIVAATKFLLNPSAPNATPPDFSPPAAATTPPADGQQPAQPPGAPQPQAPNAPQTQPPGAPQQPQPPQPQPAAPQQPPLPIPDPVADQEAERFLTLQANHKDALPRTLASLQRNREALFARHDADQEALPHADRAITRAHKTLVATLRQELNDLQRNHGEQLQDLLEERQVLQKELNTRHLEEQRTLIQPQVNLAPLLARQFTELQQQQQEEIALYQGLQQQQRNELADLFLQQLPRRGPLSLALRNLLLAQEAQITTRVTQHQGGLITLFTRQHSQRTQIHQELQQIEALPAIQAVITAIGPSANPIPRATSERTIIAQAEAAVTAAEQTTREATTHFLTIPATNAAEQALALAQVNLADAARLRIRAARDQIRIQARAAEQSYIAAQNPAQAAAQALLATTARTTAEAQLTIIQAQIRIATDAATQARTIARNTLATNRRNRNCRWGTKAVLGTAAMAGGAYALNAAGVINGAMLLTALWTAVKPF